MFLIWVCHEILQLIGIYKGVKADLKIPLGFFKSAKHKDTLKDPLHG